MKGAVFVQMFRMHWNSVLGKWHDRFFDSYDIFEIKYVFGRVRCKPEYCKRNSLVEVSDAIICKCLFLYLKALEKGVKVAFNFKFESYAGGALMYLNAGDMSVFIQIEPKEQTIYD